MSERTRCICYVSIKRHLRAKRNRIGENNRFKTRKKFPLLTRSHYITLDSVRMSARGSSYLDTASIIGKSSACRCDPVVFSDN